MKQATISIVALVVLVAGIFLFFTYGGNTATKDPAEIKELQTQDPRLTKGEAEAPVKIVEYADVLCPYCAEINEDQLPVIEKDYIADGQVNFELRLVGTINPDNSQRAAEGAYCAADQDLFWPYIDEAYGHTWHNYYQKGKSPADVSEFNEGEIEDFIKRIKGIDGTEWQDCMRESRHAATIESNQAEMARLGASGTPLFNINGKHISGSAPQKMFTSTIEAALAEAKERQKIDSAS